jgi:hypothetical protein
MRCALKRISTPRSIRYQGERRAHVRIYQFWSRCLTPLFQSDRYAVARIRDLTFLPLGRVSGGRGRCCAY